MGILFYNILLILLWPVYRVLGLVHPKVRRFIRSRYDGYRMIREYARWHANDADNGPIWLHGSSVGELDQALAVLREIKVRYPKQRVIVSVFSLSVRLRRLEDADLMFYLPLDFFWNWRTLTKLLKPRAFVTMTWDVFPNLLFHLKRRGIPAFLCSAALSPKSWRMTRWARLLKRSTYNRFTGIGAVNEANQRMFRSLVSRRFAGRVQVTGDTRYDTILFKIRNAYPGSDDRRLLNHIKALKGPLWILASTYQADDEQIFAGLPELLREHPRYQILIFPHIIDPSRLLQVQKNLEIVGLGSELFSHAVYKGQRGRRAEAKSAERILVVDRLGILALAYRYSSFCYVGGGFHHRIHNTAEPAALGRPVLTGPRIGTSPIALELAEQGSLVRCADGREVIAQANAWMENDRQRRKLGQQAEEYLKSHEGGASKFFDTFLSPEIHNTRAL
ncbi:MAG: glycosyltransferase N-terminal domain-containing protein [Leptospirales bacterium]